MFKEWDVCDNPDSTPTSRLTHSLSEYRVLPHQKLTSGSPHTTDIPLYGRVMLLQIIYGLITKQPFVQSLLMRRLAETADPLCCWSIKPINGVKPHALCINTHVFKRQHTPKSTFLTYANVTWYQWLRKRCINISLAVYTVQLLPTPGASILVLFI